MRDFLKRVLEGVWGILISLKLAVLVIASLAVTLSVATVLESLHDAKTAQYYVYRAAWFYGLLGLLGLNILAVALSRLPWKRRHTPFLMAHAGILMILVGSWITYREGLDGSLQVSEGEVNSAVELDQHVLLLKEGEQYRTVPFDWMPVAVAEKFSGREFPDFGIRVDRFIPDAEPRVRFVEVAGPTSEKSAPAVQIKILGAPMGGAPEFWLWSGDAGWSSQKLGLARFLIRKEGRQDLEAVPFPSGEARFDFIAGKNGTLTFESVSIRGEKKKGKIDLNRLQAGAPPLILEPGWKMPIRIQLKAYVAHAANRTDYIPLKVKPQGVGTAVPQPAIRISLLENPESKLWLGLGDRADFTAQDGVRRLIGYYPKRIVLPFGIQLDRFELKTNPGTMDPAAYSSFVRVVDQVKKGEETEGPPVHHITMNEPLESKGYTFYQASYIPEVPRPVTTILSVNHDPGRWLKYWGSILLILGSISLYLVKVIQRKRNVEVHS
jgi:hypothetical protein